MVRCGRAVESPLSHLRGLNVKTDRRHDRRNLLVEELQWLIYQTVEGNTRYGMTGPERALLYRLAVESGLRAGELRSLTTSSFCLDDGSPTVTIDAAYAKNRRLDTLPLKPDTAAELKIFISGKLPMVKAFNVPHRRIVARMIRVDMGEARKAWLSEADSTQERQRRESTGFLTYRDDSGRVADFHALRHTFISNLAASGVHPKTAQMLARHSTITLTMDRYTHSYHGEQSAALEVLPDLSTPARQCQQSTGTDSKPFPPAMSLSPRSGTQRTATVSIGQKNDIGDEPDDVNEVTELTEKRSDLRELQQTDMLTSTPRRGARAVERAGLENRCGLRVTVGSNPTLSVCI